MNASSCLYLCLLLTLVACGGGSSTSKSRDQVPDYTNLKQTKLDSAPLRAASAAELEQLLKNGLRLSLHNGTYAQLIDTTALAGAAESSDNSGRFSGTNVQVAGVDEADFVKYDGTYIYLATPVVYTEGGFSNSSLKIFTTDPASAGVSEVSAVPLDTSRWSNVSELYLVENAREQTTAVATLRRSWSFINFNNFLTEDIATDRMSLFYPQESGIDVTLYDVTNPAAPAEAWSVSLDGDLLGSRKIGNLLYLVSSFVPALYPLDYSATTDEQRLTNETLIEQTSIAKLLPEYRINQGAAQNLNSAAECLVPTNIENNNGHLNLVNITAIDLASRQIIESVCVNTLVQGIYTSPTHIYVGGSENSTSWENARGLSVIHKFSLSSEGVDYEATGAVKGTLGWSSPSFRMDEYDGDLRLVTTTYNDNWLPQHHLTILRQIAGHQTLTTLAQLPDNNRPQAIGKPDEDIYAVRFNGDKAYIVTFQRIDPLYVLDLSNPVDPLVAGELEIPGFSTYLHPVDDGYLFALGHEANANGQQAGVKVALFDIRDPAQPQLIDSLVFGASGSFSEAIYDHRALSFLRKNDDQLRVTLPMTLYTNTTNGEFASTQWLSTRLYQFEINGLAGSAANLTHKGTINGEDSAEQTYPQWGGNDRGILHDEAVFYIHGPEVIGSLWPTENQ